MGERRKEALRLNFDRKLKLEFHVTTVTSDAGLIAYRELDEVLGLTTMIESELADNRTGKNTQMVVWQCCDNPYTADWLVTMIPMMPNVCLLTLPCVSLWAEEPKNGRRLQQV